MDVRSYLPVDGDILCTMKGGPRDKMAIRFDYPYPLEIIMDGHVYERKVLTWDCCFGGEDFDISYIYAGKRQ